MSTHFHSSLNHLVSEKGSCKLFSDDFIFNISPLQGFDKLTTNKNEASRVDMSRYRGAIKDELHRWLKSHKIQAAEAMEVYQDEPSVFESKSDNIQNWLLPRKGWQVGGLGSMQFRKRASTWLTDSTETPCPTTKLDCPLIEQFNSCHKNTNWLKVDYEPSTQTIGMPHTDLYTHCGDLTEKSHWLMHTTISPEPTTIVDLCPSWEKIKRIHKQLSDDCWLVGSNQQTKILVVDDNDDDDEKASMSQEEGNDKWLLSGAVTLESENKTFGPFSYITEDIGDWLLNKKFMVESV